MTIPHRHQKSSGRWLYRQADRARPGQEDHGWVWKLAPASAQVQHPRTAWQPLGSEGNVSWRKSERLGTMEKKKREKTDKQPLARTDTHRHTHTHTERHRQTQRETHTHTDRHTQTHLLACDWHLGFEKLISLIHGLLTNLHQVLHCTANRLCRCLINKRQRLER